MLGSCRQGSLGLGLSGLQQALCLNPDLLESAIRLWIVFFLYFRGHRTICPAPTTPSLLTSAAAIAGLVLNDCRRTVAAPKLAIDLTAKGESVIFRTRDTRSSRKFEYHGVEQGKIRGRSIDVEF